MTEQTNILFHGSSNELVGETINPSQGEDSSERPENNLLAVYATDRRDLAIVMAILGCEDVIGGSIDEYDGERLIAKIYGNFPAQEFVYVYNLPIEAFSPTKIDKHQFISMTPQKPSKVEKVRVADYTGLFIVGTQEEQDEWIRKYGKKN